MSMCSCGGRVLNSPVVAHSIATDIHRFRFTPANNFSAATHAKWAEMFFNSCGSFITARFGRALNFSHLLTRAGIRIDGF